MAYAGEAERPRPEAFLKEAETEERRHRRGKLRIFLGYAAGVGKTYAMLLAAREAQSEGRGVAIAYVETHGRAETEALVHGFTIIPRWKIAYRGVTLEEMDLDTVLGEHPDLAVVDELAHTNAPGCRHARRYQDVEELLETGIDVYTTLNVQHIESLNDVVAQITGITVRETVPDQILEQADEVGLVDLPPDELIQRLHEGKVYVPEQASRAIDKFFRPGNLTALREIALRYLAGQVDHQMRAYMESHAIPGPWPAGERVVVCIDADPLAERLVRTGRRMAAGLDAEWIVLHVETPEYATLPEAARDRIARTLRLAEELGARTVSLPGTKASEEIIRYARAQNVSKILVGVSHHPRWIQLIHGSVVDRIMRAAGDIDVYVISAARERQHTTEPAAPEWPGLFSKPYLYSAAVVAVAVVIGALVHGVWAQANVTMLFLLAVVVTALQWGRGPATLVAAVSLAAFAVFFGPPSFTYTMADTQYLVTVAALLFVGLVIGTLASRTREQAQAARSREGYMAALHALSGELAATNDLDAILQAVGRHIAATFGRSVAIFLPKGETLEPRLMTPGFPLTENERAVADWVFRHGHSAGYGTDTVPAAAARYMPLKTAQRIVGVLGVQPAASGPRLNPEQRRLLDAFASQAALAIERVELAEEARRGDIARETERLQTALLNSISHDLRTPLASITGALTTLADHPPADEPVRRELLQNAREQAERLNHLVGSLLDMNRLEAGTLRLRTEPGDVEDLIGASIAQLGEAVQHREIRVSVDPKLPLVPMDFALVTQALVNMLDNALRYSPPDAPIEITARLVGNEVQIRVEDRGPGVPPGDVARIFDKFYRIQHDGAGHGAGLGLAISHGIIDAHGGRIWAANRPDGGAIVAFALPVRLPEPSGGLPPQAGDPDARGAGRPAAGGDRASQWATPGRAS
ncbi:MAG TPA: sensor histidine kinase KdpD [bacterium]|nr:sensor histidine kinase KdpD [bacterium]